MNKHAFLQTYGWPMKEREDAEALSTVTAQHGKVAE